MNESHAHKVDEMTAHQKGACVIAVYTRRRCRDQGEGGNRTWVARKGYPLYLPRTEKGKKSREEAMPTRYFFFRSSPVLTMVVALVMRRPCRNPAIPNRYPALSILVAGADAGLACIVDLSTGAETVCDGNFTGARRSPTINITLGLAAGDSG